jgi:hypothetical protein
MERLKFAVQAITQPFEIQKQLFPEFVCVADELALEWEMAMDDLRFQSGNVLTENQKSAIENLDKYMESISGSAHIQYWCDEALHYSLEWKTMRKLAYKILVEMGWKQEIPPIITDRIYIANNN